MDTQTSLAERLKGFRDSMNIDVPTLAQASGVSKAYIYQIESARRKTPSADVLLRLARALHTTVPDLMGAEEEEDTKGALDEAPDALKDFVTRKGKKLGVRKEDVDVLKSIRYRGRRPSKMEDYELLHLFIKRILE